MDKIPISFDYQGKHYSGYFVPVHGAGANVWYLMIDNYYCGRLRLTENQEWAFDANKFGAEELTDYFADVIIAWRQ